MTRNSQLWKSITYRLAWDDGTVLYVHKGDSRHSRWYVLDADRRYLTRGFASELAAREAAARIHGNKAG